MVARERRAGCVGDGTRPWSFSELESRRFRTNRASASLKVEFVVEMSS